MVTVLPLFKQTRDFHGSMILVDNPPDNQIWVYKLVEGLSPPGHHHTPLPAGGAGALTGLVAPTPPLGESPLARREINSVHNVHLLHLPRAADGGVVARRVFITSFGMECAALAYLSTCTLAYLPTCLLTYLQLTTHNNTTRGKGCDGKATKSPLANFPWAIPTLESSPLDAFDEKEKKTGSGRRTDKRGDGSIV